MIKIKGLFIMNVELIFRAIFGLGANEEITCKHCQYVLGSAFANKCFVFYNSEKATLWLEKSAKQGYKPAEDLLKVLHSGDCDKEKQDYMHPLYWCEKFAKNSDIFTQYVLGKYNHNSESVKRKA